MKQPDIVYEQHTMRFPFSYLIFGKNFEMTCNVAFGYTEGGDGDYRVKVESITGTTTEDEVEYDMTYLTEDMDSMYAGFIIACIIQNKKYWDFETVDKEWWSN